MRNRRVFIQGNNAIKVDEFSKETNFNQERNVVKTKKVNKKSSHNKVAKATTLHIAYTFMLSLVIVATVATLVLLLKSQFTVADQSNKVIELKKELVSLKRENDKIASNIEKSVNMDEVYRIATEDMKMIMPSADNIKYIEPTYYSYTIQYTDIVVNDEKGVDLGSFLGFISSEW